MQQTNSKEPGNRETGNGEPRETGSAKAERLRENTDRLKQESQAEMARSVKVVQAGRDALTRADEALAQAHQRERQDAEQDAETEMHTNEP